MFQFPPFALTTSVTGLQPAGLPHSDISGSKPVCSSPELFAAYHVLLRLQKPRHPPSALVTFSLSIFDWMNHKNFLVIKTLFYYTCSRLLVALKLQSTTNTIDSLSYTRYRLSKISSSNFTSLSFLKLVNELFLSFLLADCVVRLRILTPHNHKVAASFVARLPCTQPK